MSIAVIDMLGDVLNPEVLPKNENSVLVYNEGSTDNFSVISSYPCTNDIIEALRGGKHSIMVSSEAQRGLVFSLILSMRKIITIYTPRPEIISVYLQGTPIESLKTLVRSSSPQKPREERPRPQTTPKKTIDYFEVIYQESLKKYVESMLVPQIRATKSKSAKAQLKNLIDGIITSTRKKVGQDIPVSSEEIVERLFADLERHQIISGGTTLEYSDELIEAYFGRRPTKVFRGDFREPNVEELKEPERQVPRPGDDSLNEVVLEIAENLIEANLAICKSIGQLVIFTKKEIKAYCEGKNKKYSDSQTQSLSQKLLKFILDSYFCVIDSGFNAEEISKSPQNYFVVKIDKI